MKVVTVPLNKPKIFYPFEVKIEFETLEEFSYVMRALKYAIQKPERVYYHEEDRVPGAEVNKVLHTCLSGAYEETNGK